ncbi:MAG: DUF3387 domain-containing protein [Trichormus sp. ATA11-4-KO1]|nr:DUF3387 domain-containing protein [Trichormus sp. ATA11-4-KO1]
MLDKTLFSDFCCSFNSCFFQNLTEEELAIFDLLTKPEIKLTKQEEQEVKQVAKELSHHLSF